MNASSPGKGESVHIFISLYLTLSVSLSLFSLSFSLSLSLSFSLALSLPLSLPPSLPTYLPHSLLPSLPPSLPPFPSLSLSLSLPPPPSGSRSAASLLSLVDEGDEVIIFEPFYPFLLGAIKLAGAVPRVVRMRAPDFVLHEEDVAAVMSSKTRVLIHNS
jgi:hypothetical protein